MRAAAGTPIYWGHETHEEPNHAVVAVFCRPLENPLRLDGRRLLYPEHYRLDHALRLSGRHHRRPGVSPNQHRSRKRITHSMNPLMLAYLVIGVIATAIYVWAVRHRT